MIRMVSSHLLHSLHRSMDAPSNAAPHPTLHGAPSLHDLWPSSLCLSLLSLPVSAPQVSWALSHVGTFSVGALVPDCRSWPVHLDLSVFRAFGIHRDNSPVTRGRAAVSTQLGEAQISSDPGCVEFEMKPNILLTAKPGPAK